MRSVINGNGGKLKWKPTLSYLINLPLKII